MNSLILNRAIKLPGSQYPICKIISWAKNGTAPGLLLKVGARNRGTYVSTLHTHSHNFSLKQSNLAFICFTYWISETDFILMKKILYLKKREFNYHWFIWSLNLNILRSLVNLANLTEVALTPSFLFKKGPKNLFHYKQNFSHPCIE